MNTEQLPLIFENLVIASDAAPAKGADAAELVAGMIHDFNNILHVIQAHAGLIGSQPGGEQEICEHAEAIRGAVEEGVLLVRQFAGEAGTEPGSRPGNINALLQRVIKSLAPVFHPGIDVTWDLDPKTPDIPMDPGLVYRALLNLCVNAGDAMPKGGSLIVRTGTIAGTALRRRFAGATRQLYVAITLADTGLGMEAAVKERIFERHFTSKPPAHGTGLGLSIVQDAVTRHAGFIDVTSEPGCGSAFRIYLPASGNQAPEDSIAVAQSGKQRAPYAAMVLYAEDDPRLLGLMQRFLEKQGLKVLTARDGLEALDVHSCHRNEISAVVFDSHLPKLDGWEAYQKMKRVNPNVKGILATGYITAVAETRLVKGELSGIVQKPYSGEEILSVIKQVVGSH